MPGSADWLIGAELKYGGKVTGVLRRKVSPHDPRPKDVLWSQPMAGGDRMLDHGYAPHYAKHLKPLLKLNRPAVIVECGILKGTGLAIWCDLFPQGRVIGLDLDLSHFNDNLEKLRRRGAFQLNRPEVYRYDQFMDQKNFMGKILAGRKIDVAIDDGCHVDEAILTTFKSVRPYLADRFVYFVEDNRQVHKKIKSKYPDLKIVSKNALSVISSGR